MKDAELLLSQCIELADALNQDGGAVVCLRMSVAQGMGKYAVCVETDDGAAEEAHHGDTVTAALEALHGELVDRGKIVAKRLARSMGQE